ncbi:hypothetical protein BX070DRAFT_228503 [Coemansia spiralis]|nr:hypothetical protein BX070DRAFT_228503 [Coemansia spiralis]
MPFIICMCVRTAGAGHAFAAPFCSSGAGSVDPFCLLGAFFYPIRLAKAACGARIGWSLCEQNNTAQVPIQGNKAHMHAFVGARKQRGLQLHPLMG